MQSNGWCGKIRVSQTTNYTYDHSGRLVRERTTSIFTNGGATNKSITYLYDCNTIVGMILNGVKYFFQRNIQGDVVGVYDSTGTKVVGFRYDAFGRCTVIGDVNLAQWCKIRYRGYYYDTETGLYWVQTRYYNPDWCRWISPDSISYLDPETPHGLNLYLYCGNDPVNYVDPSGHIPIDIILDVGFIIWDIINLCTKDGHKNWENWAALGFDIAFAALPYVSGGGQVVKSINMADDISDMAKFTVVGETTVRVKSAAVVVNATDNLYDGFMSYNKLKSAGKLGHFVAEICGKADNALWLYGKLKHGYKVFDIGIDLTRVTRSGSYFMERLILWGWQTRNIFKALFHLL